jgi:hypothetical protein
MYTTADYSVSTLATLFDRYSHKGSCRSQVKSHLDYFGYYFDTLEAKTVIIEYPYTDRDYLEDYAAYYARCHVPYEKRCARLHFFNERFDQALLHHAIQRVESAVQQLRRSYLGFIVVKPLPFTVIGRTCLATYGNKGRERSFPITHDYPVHIFGIELSVNSIPFQEQDADVAACATSALWSVFNATGHLFQHHIPSPAEITEVATSSQRLISRAFPAGEGLSGEQMADAIRSVGLEPLDVKAENLELLLISVSAYLRAKIPCLLVGALINTSNKRKQESLGFHAVAVAGHDVPKAKVHPYGSTKTLFSATGITRLYAHDDQIGPFARIEVARTNQLRLLTTWPDKNGKSGKIFLKPSFLLLPVYHKIRVPISEVIVVISSFDEYLERARRAQIVRLAKRITWDLSLISVADLKSRIYEENNLIGRFRELALFEDMPRYLWRAIASSEASKLFEVLFDATDLLQGGHVVAMLPYCRKTCKALAILFSHGAVLDEIRLTGIRGLEMTIRLFRHINHSLLDGAAAA